MDVDELLDSTNPENLPEPDLTDNAETVLEKRYLLTDEDGNIDETPKELFWRVASTIARPSIEYERNAYEVKNLALRFYEAMAEGRFMPNSPTLTGAGTDLGMLSACFVYPVEDTMTSPDGDGILDTAKNAALTHKTGGGCIGGESTVITDSGPKNMREFCESSDDSRVLSYGSGSDFSGVAQKHTTHLDAGRVYEVEFETGSIRASDWHPFFVWDGSDIVQKRADEISSGDAIIGSTRWGGETPSLDTEAWTDGVIVSEGGFDDSVNGPRLRVVNSVEDIVSGVAGFFSKNYHESCDDRYKSDMWEFSVTGPTVRSILGKFDHDADEMSVYNKHLPEYIWSASVDSQLSMIAGLLDGDGSYSVDKSEFSYHTVSERLATEVETLAGILGLRTRTRHRTNVRENEVPIYEVIFKQSPWLIEAINQLSVRLSGEYGWSDGIIPFDTDYREEIDQRVTDTHNNRAWRKGVEIDGHNIAVQKWFRKGVLPRNSAALILRALGYREKAAAVHSAEIVQSVSVEDEGDTLYDLTVPGPQNYVAGDGCFVVAHNTGFDFSKIRPKGEPVQSTNGVASGPVSFMKMYSDITNTMKQGGCLTADTLVATAEGAKRIDDVEEGDLVYSWDEDSGYVLVSSSGSWKTKSDTTVYEVETDKGLTFKATPDHPVMKRARGGSEGDYREVQDLSEGDPLLPLTRYKKSSGYTWITLHDGEDTRVPEHQWMVEQVGLDGEHVHHVDGNKSNNVLSNLEVMEESEHQRLHSHERLEKGEHPFQNLNTESVKKSVEGYKKWFASLSPEEQRDMQSKRAKSLNKKLMEKGEHNFQTDHPSKTEEGREKQKKGRIAQSLWKVMQKGFEITKEKWPEAKSALYNSQQYTVEHIEEVFGSFDEALEYADARNHRVVSVEEVGTADVYNMEVPGTHNYVVCDEDRNGVVVSNTRRGANMGIMRVDHPDILEFINCKTEDGEIENFNISVAVTEDFMEKARNGEEYELRFEGEVYDTLNASDVLDKIIDNAHKNGEPGLFFVDRANAENPVPHLGEIRATNPCGEIPLPPYGVCNLGHVNLAEYVHEDGVDWDGLQEAVELGIRFLDNVIDANDYPLDKVRERSNKTRRIGLGVMGWADALINAGVPYDSKDATLFAKDLSHHIYRYAVEASEQLAEERGPYPAWEESEHESPRRNAYVNTVAPTGTTSIIAGTSGGIEPNYAFAFKRHQADTEMVEVHDAVTERYDTSDKSLSEIRDLVAGDPVLVSAHEIAPEWHIKHQAAWQTNTEQAISKTILLPEEADTEDVREAYMLADELGCKGITVYRDGSREGQALSMGDEDDESASESLGNGYEKRPSTLTGQSTRIEAPEGTGYLTINEKDGQPFETFLNIGKAGSSLMAISEAMGRLMSLALRHGIDVAKIYEQLRGIGSRQEMGFGENRVGSLPDAVARALHQYMGADGNHENGPEGTVSSCPDCGADLQMSEGCETCVSCGYSRCG